LISCHSRIFVVVITGIAILQCSEKTSPGFYQYVLKHDKQRILEAADKYLIEEPITITSSISPRSAGGRHDFYSEGDYWWPDPDDPDGPYIRRDGMSNPNNFTDHRKAMIRFSMRCATLAAAYKITTDEKYANHAIRHIKAWFVDENTLMNPHLLYAQAIKGRVTGRGVGIIDTIHLVEVAKSIGLLAEANLLIAGDFEKIRDWFRSYMDWMTTHEYGIDERDRKNNHGTCWVMQLAAFADLTGDIEKLKYCRERFKTILLPNQVARDGSFPLELARTKPYGYSLFNLDAMATVCHILSSSGDNLWEYQTKDSSSMKKVMQFMYPFIKEKSIWPYPADVMYFDDWPARHPALLFAGMAYSGDAYLDLWGKLPAEPNSMEGLRNFPIRQPILWINK